jgi:hypothetical protein
MMNWRSGKGGFVGGLKYLIKGVFQFAHSLTSVAPVGPTPDCYIASQGHIIDTPLSDIAAIGTITDTIAAIGTINDLAVASIGTLTDTNAAQGSLCND